MLQLFHKAVVAGVACSEDKLKLTPGASAGTATPIGIPVCDWSTRETEGSEEQWCVMNSENST